MNTKKYFSWLVGTSLISLLFINCGTSNSNSSNISLEKNPPFAIHQVYFQKWVAGIQEGGFGINFYFSAKDVKENVVFKEVFFRKKIASVKSISENNKNYMVSFSKLKKDVTMSSNPLEEAQNTPPKTFEFPLKEKEALISYLYNNKLYYYKIEDITQKNTLNYPSSNPNLD